jgi:hypothetical protein
MKRALCVILILIMILALVSLACIIDPVLSETASEQATRIAATSAKEATQISEAVRMTQTAQAKQSP